MSSSSIQKSFIKTEYENVERIFEKDEELMNAIKKLPELYLKIRMDNILKVKKDEGNYND